MDIRVIAMNGTAGVDWLIEGSPAKHSSIKFKKDDGETKVRFKLKDETGLGLRFDRQAPFWDEKNCTTGCPADGATSDQTEVLDCEDKTLTVLNRNTEECTVTYKMYFTDQQGGRHCVDPEFKNGVKT